MSSIFWTAYSHGDRHQVISAIKEAATGYGDIVDFRFFSDISLVLTIEAQERHVDALFNRLKEHLLLDETEPLNATSRRERTIFLNITFTGAAGNLRVEVPAVPG